jgi:hypothetical protein
MIFQDQLMMRFWTNFEDQNNKNLLCYFFLSCNLPITRHFFAITEVYYSIASMLILGLGVLLAHNTCMDLGCSCYSWALKKCHRGALGDDHVLPSYIKKSNKMAVIHCGRIVAACLEGPLEVADMLASW